MALTPDLDITVPDLFESEAQPSYTYGFDVDTGRISGFVDGLEARKQFIIKAILTKRFVNVIYDDDYGSEVELIRTLGYSDALLEIEIQRSITEALIYDERILAVREFNFSRNRDSILVTFTVDTDLGTISDIELNTQGGA